MKQRRNSPDQNQKPAGASAPATAAGIRQNIVNFNCMPASEQVARRACFSFVNQVSSQGHAARHWLAAEELLAERNLGRIHGHPHPANHHHQP